MANAEHIKALLQSHIEGDDERFLSVAIQAAAHEARLGHGRLATEIRDLVEAARARRGEGRLVAIAKPRGELAGLLEVLHPRERLPDLILDPTVGEQIQRVIREQRHSADILAHGLTPRRKLLLVGPPGTGKTLTASVLAGELGIPLLRVRLDGLITKYMGETAAKLRQVFDATGRTRGVYLFDEFDAIGSQRGLPNDVGEVRRILNSFLQLIEQDDSPSLILAATNHPDILDIALLRRFDDVIQYGLPTERQLVDLLRQRLKGRMPTRTSWKRLAQRAVGLSFAEAARAVDEVLKDAIVEGREKLTEAEVGAMLDERHAMQKRLKR